MKRLFSMILCLSLVLGLFAACGKEETPKDTAVSGQTGSWDFAAARAALEPDTVVMTINGVDVTWDAYFYWLASLLQGLSPADVTSWDGAVGDGTNATFSEYFLAAAETSAAQFCIMESMAAAAGITLNAEDEAALDASWKQDVETYGEGSEEAFLDYLDSLYLSRDYYTAINRAVLSNNRRFAETYGARGEVLTDEDVMQFAETQGYLCCMQILFQTTDAEGNERDEAAMTALRTELEGYQSQLADAAGTEAVVDRFRELMLAHTEDASAADSPEGFLFAPAEMPEAFSAGVAAAGVYEMAIVESSYGLHLILRLPITPETVVGTDVDGSTLDLRYLTAAWLDDNTLTEALEGYEVHYAEAFTALDMNRLFPLKG